MRNGLSSRHLITRTVLALVPLLCVVVFFLPVEVQARLMVNPTVFNPLTFVTASFVHGELMHLVNNVVVYFLVVGCGYYLNVKSGRERFFLYSLLAVFFVLPIFYYSISFFLFPLLLNLKAVSFGLSLAVSGLVGLLVPSLMIFLRDGLEVNMRPSQFLLSIICITGLLIVLTYFRLRIYDVMVVILLVFIGVWMGKDEFSKIWDFIITARKSKKYKKEVVAVLSTIYLYFAFVVLLFPSVIVEPSGVIVGIFAHYFGIFFGLLVPYYLIPK